MGNDFFQYGPTPPAPPAPAPAREPASAEGNRAILAELSDEDWEKFIAFATRRRYPAGAVILEIGQAGGALGFARAHVVTARAARPRRARTGPCQGQRQKHFS